MAQGKNSRKVFGVALIVLLAAGVPAQAKPWWKILIGVASTVGGVFSSSAGVGVALIGLQGTLLAGDAKIATDPTLTDLADNQPSYAAKSNPQFCEDGGLSCPAILALQRMDIKPIAVQSDWTPEEVAFANATNRVIEDENIFSTHVREGASVDVKKYDLQLMASSLETAAQAYDKLNIPASQNLTQGQIDSFQKQAGTSGLPKIEQSFWENSNLTAPEVDAITQFLATADVKLGVSSVSMSRVLHEEAANLAAATK